MCAQPASRSSARQKPKGRFFGGVSVVAGAVLLAFEIRRFSVESGERWFWLAVAALMIALGASAFFKRSEP